MSEPLLTKRLHISGLTPSITPADLERRLSSFGKVKAMDGFGALDGLGDPRKFGFVTIEIGAKELARCLNVLSGSTWKGAKLRIGEAKPDFRERLAQTNAQPLRPVRSKRTRSRCHGRPSSTLPLVPLSAAAASSTPGWIITSSGRVVRPMRMRPERPLVPIHDGTSLSKAKVNEKVKKRAKPPPIRARRRLIDPTKWDSTYLKGVFLDNVSVLPVPKDALEPADPAKYGSVDKEEEDETDKDGAHSGGLSPPPQPLQDRTRDTLSAQQPLEADVTTHSYVSESMDIRDEANAALAMLHQMFGDDEDWEGRESVDEMEGSENIEAKRDEMPVHEDVEMEEISDKVSAQATEPAPQTNLKTLFAPKEDASFSLVKHLDLDLDLELDTDILGISSPPGAPQGNCRPSEPAPSTPRVVGIPITVATAKARSRVILDPSLPLLFPSPDLLPHPYTPSSATETCQRGTPACFLFPSDTRVRGLYQLPPRSTFTRLPQDTRESIRERWEKDKPSLTREWKKAWREAKGSRRGRAGAGGEIGGGF